MFITLTTLLLGACSLAAEGSRSVHRPENRIIDGELASLGEFPYMASLRKNDKHHCGAVIFNEEYLLTVAHCIDTSHPEAVKVWAGFTNLDNPGEFLQEREVARIIWPLDYDPTVAFVKDIAVIKVMTPFEFNDNVGKIDLPPDDSYEYTGDAVIVGWGVTDDTGTTTSDMHKAVIPVHPRSLCVSSYGNKFPQSLLCAGPLEGGVDSCKGDSGGPLVCPTEDGGSILCGIIAGGIGCGFRLLPGFYTATAKYLIFIRDSMWEA
ncbi:trypsin-1 [Anabrus simplex]|uniref:trypsin-1 n=1 Tax=Anabrus simplex TaxID=316456 RepID=UPI0034DCE5C8